MEANTMTKCKNTIALLGAALCLAAGGPSRAQDAYPANVVKVAASYYNPTGSTEGVSGIGVPPGADVSINGAWTALLTYERMFTPNIGLEFVVGIPPKITADAAGSLAFLGNDILSAKVVAPTLLLNYHFGSPEDKWRPYVGVGINYTKFSSVESRLDWKVEMGDSWGWAAQGGIAYAIDKSWGLFASVAYSDVKSNIVVTGPTVLTATADFKPFIYTVGVSYGF
jgi:outer membrane protein